MSAAKLTSCVAVTAAAVASMTTRSDPAYSESFFRFPFFSSSPSNSPSPKDQSSDTKSESSSPEEPNNSGFNPESLEIAAEALRKINNSPYRKQVFDLMREQETTRLAELDAEKVYYELIQSQGDIDRLRKMAEEQRNLIQEQNQRQAQVLRFEDELARKRMQTDHENQRQHNVELVKMQEDSSVRKEQARQATEEQIQSQKRQTERERAWPGQRSLLGVKMVLEM